MSTVVHVTAQIDLDPAESPVLKGSSSYLRPRVVEWSCYSSRPQIIYVSVRGYMRNEERWARGQVLYATGSPNYPDGIPDWIPRPSAGWLASLASVGGAR